MQKNALHPSAKDIFSHLGAICQASDLKFQLPVQDLPTYEEYISTQFTETQCCIILAMSSRGSVHRFNQAIEAYNRERIALQSDQNLEKLQAHLKEMKGRFQKISIEARHLNLDQPIAA